MGGTMGWGFWGGWIWGSQGIFVGGHSSVLGNATRGLGDPQNGLWGVPDLGDLGRGRFFPLIKGKRLNN